MVDLLEKLEIVLGLGDSVVVLDGRIGQVGGVARLAGGPVILLLLAVLVLAQDVEQVLSLRLERAPELRALSRRQRILLFLGVHAAGRSNSDARIRPATLAAGTPHAPPDGMTKAEEFKTLAERKGRQKRTSVKKPKKSEWSHARRRAGAKATHALEVTATGRPSSRKSTRASANRAKPDAPMDLTEELRRGAPRAVASTAQVKRERVRGKPL
jgi:hypothetical protein